MSLHEDYLRGVQRINEQVNLTRINSFSEGMLLHVEDSLSARPELEAAPEGPLADIGTGGGFPGVPIAIEFGRQVTLVDSVQKKLRVLEPLISELGLDDFISFYPGRIEDFGCEQKGRFAVVTARALAPLPVLLELASPLLRADGVLIAYKSVQVDAEVEAAARIERETGMTLASDRSFTLSDEVTPRRILVYRKSGQPSLKLPRPVGFAQRKPLAPLP